MTIERPFKPCLSVEQSPRCVAVLSNPYAISLSYDRSIWLYVCCHKLSSYNVKNCLESAWYVKPSLIYRALVKHPLEA